MRFSKLLKIGIAGASLWFASAYAEDVGDYIDRLLEQATAEELEEMDPGLYDYDGGGDDGASVTHEETEATVATVVQETGGSNVRAASGWAEEMIALVSVGASGLLFIVAALVRCCVLARRGVEGGVGFADRFVAALAAIRAVPARILARARAVRRPTVLALPPP